MGTGDFLAKLYDWVNNASLGYIASGIVILFGGILLLNASGTIFKALSSLAILAMVFLGLTYWVSPNHFYTWVAYLKNFTRGYLL